MRFGESTKAALDQMPSRPKLTPVEGNPFARQTEAVPPPQQHEIADVKYRTRRFRPLQMRLDQPKQLHPTGLL
jgi:hypothetical protein